MIDAVLEPLDEKKYFPVNVTTVTFLITADEKVKTINIIDF